MFWVAHDFGNGTFAMIVVARKTRVSRQMRRLIPLFIVGDGESICALEPREVSCPRGLLCVIHRENHGSKKRRLRSREVVGSIGVENRPVVLDLEKKIFDHSFGHRQAVFSKEAANYEKD